jgi:hypothetical protein
MGIERELIEMTAVNNRGSSSGIKVVIALIVVMVLSATVASASVVWTETKLTASDGAEVDYFGLTVAVDADRVVVGAPFDDDGGIQAGSVYLYESNGAGEWAETKLTASDAATGGFFGRSVAMDGDRIVVGSSNTDGTSSGSVYVFESDGLGGWVETKLTASDAADGDLFGINVAVDGDRLVVGAPFDDAVGPDSGSVYVFESDGDGDWAETKLIPSDAPGEGFFGRSVALDGGRVVVGAEHNADRWTQGSVYVFESDGLGGWVETKLTASDGAIGDLFGVTLAVEGDRIFAGAAFDDDRGIDSGSVYVFESDGLGGWVETKLVASDTGQGDHFGWLVAVDSGRLVVGAPADDDRGTASGSVYVFESDGLGGWVETKLTASDGSDTDSFGSRAAVDGDRLVVGASGDNNATGSVYIYEASPDADGDGVANDEDNCPVDANPHQTDTDGDGMGDVCDPDDDNDGVSDEDEIAAGTDPLNPDSDGDGTLDGSDPDTIGSAVAGLPPTSFASSGHSRAIQVHLDQVEGDIDSGRIDRAIARLMNLRTHVDGCDGSSTETPDADDWIVDCHDQRTIRSLIDTLITNLGG